MDFSKYSPEELLLYISTVDDNQRKELFNNQDFIINFREILNKKSYDEWDEYRDLVRRINVEEFFKTFSSEYIKDVFDRNDREKIHALLCSLLEINPGKTLEFFLNDDLYFEMFIDNFYYCSILLNDKVNYDNVYQLLKRIENNDYNVNLSFIANFSKDRQLQLLREDFSDNFIIKLVNNSSNEVKNEFFFNDKRFFYLWDRFDIKKLIINKYKLPDTIIYKRDFFDKLISNSLVESRANVNQIASYMDPEYFYDKFDKYEEDIINRYNLDTRVFSDYEELLTNIDRINDRGFIQKGISYLLDSRFNYNVREFISYDNNDKIIIRDKEGLYKYLVKESSLKLNELIVDRLFHDNIYNVRLNIKEMLRYHDKLDKKILSDDKVLLYRVILNMDSIDSGEILELYKRLKDVDMAYIFYNDMRLIKDKSYDFIKKDLDDSNYTKRSKDMDLSNKYGIDVFDYRDSNYTMLVRAIGNPYREITSNKRDCYTIMNSDNPNLMSSSGFVYGYYGFDNDAILHMFEEDDYSIDIRFSNNDKENIGTEVVNRIMTSEELATSSYIFSEIQIINKKVEDKSRNLYKAMKPDYLICFDEAKERQIMEAKRLEIPIIIISHKRAYTNDSSYRNEDNKYVFDTRREDVARKGR